MQIFVYRDRGFTREFVERAAAGGFDALVLTTDNQLLGNRERDLRNGFTIPPRFSPLDVAGHGRQAALADAHGAADLPKITFANYAEPGRARPISAAMPARWPGMLDPSLSWRDVEWLRGLVEGPFLLKGIAASRARRPRPWHAGSTA